MHLYSRSMDKLEKIRTTFNSIIPPQSISNQEFISTLQGLSPFIKSILNEKDEFNFDEVTSSAYNKSIHEAINSLNYFSPDQPHNFDDILHFLKNKVVPFFNYENTKFLSYIPRSPTNISILAESLVPIFNQFVGTAKASPLATAIESLTIRWIGNNLGFTGDFFGAYTMGGSQANLEALYTALVSQLPWNVKEIGVISDQRPIIYLTNQAHLCIPKSARLLGLGDRSLHFVETDENFQMNIKNLREQIIADQENSKLIPSVVVLTAGTTNTGAIDEISSIVELAREFGLWVHIDASYGGFAKLADHPISEQLNDLHLVDSLAIDTHKWFYTPLEGGIAIVKRGELLKNAYRATAEYYEDAEIEEEMLLRNFSDYGIALTRKWRGLMVWFNFLYYGIEGISKLITRNILLADYLREKLRMHGNFELLGNSQLGIVCFSHLAGEERNIKIFESINSEKSRFLIGKTRLKGRIALRVSILNEFTDLNMIDELYKDIVELSI